jgi:glyoxylase-like metal-dependent hydrolase (beta-lactamase superfamily II)
VQERAGRAVPVYGHPADAPKVAEWGWRWKDRLPHYLAYLARLGVPAEAIGEMAGRIGGGFKLARRVDDVHPITEGEVLHAGRLRLEALHLPGHTPGMICLWDAEHRLLFSADHLLEKVSPNPIVELGPDGEDGVWRPLVAYLASLERARALEVELVLPGHGPPFAGHREIIDGLLAFYERRQDKIRAALAEAPHSGWDVVRALFPAVRAQDLFLAISEAMANVEVLESRGEVARWLEDGAYRFGLAAA